MSKADSYVITGIRDKKQMYLSNDGFNFTCEIDDALVCSKGVANKRIDVYFPTAEYCGVKGIMAGKLSDNRMY